MIANKQPASQQYIISWILKNTFAYSIHQCQTKLNTKNIHTAIKCFRQYLINRLADRSIAVKIDKIGILYRKQRNNNQSKEKIVVSKIYLSSDILLKFACIQGQQKIDEKLKYQVLNYSQIAGRVFLNKQFVKYAIDSYISATLQLATLEPDRRCKMDLGIVLLEFYKKKITIKKPISKQNQNINKNYFNKFFCQKMYTKDTKLQKRWQESLSGTLGKHLNILDIQNNLDKGAAVTSKYLRLLHQHNQ